MQWPTGAGTCRSSEKPHPRPDPSRVGLPGRAPARATATGPGAVPVAPVVVTGLAVVAGVVIVVGGVVIVVAGVVIVVAGVVIVVVVAIGAGLPAGA
ncbi:MAG: hypothetical protein ACLP7F_22930 [Acidimicrobiales bacterium]